MFSFFRSRTESKVNKPAVSSPNIDEEDEDGNSEDDQDNAEAMDLSVEVGGGKGWPTNATVLLYHEVQGLICVGTESGAIYVYGDGFQFVRPWLTDDPVEVVSVISIHPDKIIALYANNSVVAMELPALNIIDLLQPNWLQEREGDITAIYSDSVGEKGFVYVGTSSGSLHVLDCMHSMVRVCDYKVSLNDFGLGTGGWTISDIQISPKDDRYIAVGFDGGEIDFGAIVIFDFGKSKPYKTFKLSAVSSLYWHHAGEILYAGTLDGRLYLINIEKGSCNAVWNANDEKVEDLDEDSDFKPAIRRLFWMPSQTANSDIGCLFLQLSSPGSDNDNLKNVVVGLTPSTSYNEYHVSFAMPPLAMEKVVSFRVIPSYEKDEKLRMQASQESGEEEATASVSVTPAVLLLVHRANEYEPAKFERHLKILRCPTSGISDWGLEIGTLPDPRKASEVLAGSAEVTSVAALVPDYRNVLSIGRNLVSGVINDEDKLVKTSSAFQAPDLTSMPSTTRVTEEVAKPRQSRRISAREFFSSNQSQLFSATELDIQLSQYDTWEMVLSSGIHEEHNREKQMRHQDIVFLGHGDGTIIAYGVSLPDGDKEYGKGAIWLPLAALRCGTTNITQIACDDTGGLMAFADEAGFLVFYQLYDETNQIGTFDVLRQTYNQVKSDVEGMISNANASEKTYTLEELADPSQEQRFRHYDYCTFNSQKPLFRSKFNTPVTSILILGSLLMVVVGLADGSVHYCNDLTTGVFTLIPHSESTGATSAVLALDYGFYSHNGSTIVAIFAYIQSGHLLVIDTHTMKLAGFNVAWSIMNDSAEKDENEKVVVSQLLNGQFRPIERPSLLASLYLQASNKLSVNVSKSAESEQSAVSPPPANTSPSPADDKRTSSRRTTFFFSRASVVPPPQPPTTSSNPSTTDRATTVDDIAVEVKRKGGITLDRENTPVEFTVVHGKQLVRFSLVKMIAPTVRRKGDTMSEITKGVSGVKIAAVAKKPLITGGALFLSRENDADADKIDQWEHYFGCVDSEGLLRLVDIDKRKPISFVNLMEGLTFSNGEEVNFKLGCALPNGNYYLLQEGGMLHASTVSVKDAKFRYTLPDRASATCEALSSKLMLLHGREQKKAAASKRRSSVMKLINNATGTDLYKIFSKTRDQQKKEELFDTNSSSPKRGENEEGVMRARANTSKITTDMAEIRENFQERGEKINRIALKMSDFRQSAQQFKQAAAQERARLERQNNRWGLF